MTNASLPANSWTRHRLLWPAMAIMLIVGWSSGFIGIRYANEEASVFLLLFWRMLLAGLILLPFALALGPRPSLWAVLWQAGFGVMAMFLYLGGFALAIEQRVPTGLVALISDLLPLAIAVLSRPVLGARLSPQQWLGTGIAVAGVLIVSFDSLSIGTAPIWAYGLTVGSMLVFAMASVLLKRRQELHIPIHQSLCIQSLTGSVRRSCAAGHVELRHCDGLAGAGCDLRRLFGLLHGLADLSGGKGQRGDLSQSARHDAVGLGAVRRAPDRNHVHGPCRDAGRRLADDAGRP